MTRTIGCRKVIGHLRMGSNPFNVEEMPDWAKRWIQRMELVSKEAHQSSDRACAIVMAASVEELLRSLLINYLPKSNVQINQIVAPGNMRRLIDISEATGLIYGKLANSLRSIADVRNVFAHRVLDDPSFESQEILRAISNLTLPVNLSDVDQYRTPRAKYMMVCGISFLVLVLQHLNLIRLPIRNENLGTQTLTDPRLKF